MLIKMLAIELALLLCVTVHVYSVAIPKIESSELLYGSIRAFEKNDLKDQNPSNEIQTTNETNICTTAACLKEANRMRSFLNPDVDPCDDFYEFVCGKYIRDTVLSEDEFTQSAFSLAQDEVNRQLESVLLEEPIQNESKAFKLAKQFIKICMDETTLNEKGVTPLVELIETYGGWPVVKGGEWNSDDWDWIEICKRMSNDGLPSSFLVNIIVSTDFEDSSKNMIKIERAESGLKSELLLKGSSHESVRAYLDFMIDAAVMFGANRTRAEKEMTEVLQFEIDLANIDSGDTYQKLSIETLQEMHPFINWLNFINWNLKNVHNVDKDEIVNLFDGTFVREIESTLQNTSKHTIANYFAWRLVLFGADALGDALYQRFQQFLGTTSGTTITNTRSSECPAQTIEFLPIATASIYARKFFNEKSRRTAVEVAKMIHQEFLQTLQNVSWLDEKSRAAAISKANSMFFHIGYPDELVDDKKLDEYYKDLELQSDSLFYSMLRILQFNRIYEINQLRKPVNKTDWIEHSLRTTKVDAFYSVLENSIQFPASILQDRFFSADRPFYMNFGTIGFFVGHEITHGFDEEGRNFDSNANYVNWWANNTSDMYNLKAKCFIEQYSNYTDTSSNTTVDGKRTCDENIADNGGIKTAYAAYQKYVERNGSDSMLPGLNYTANQLFWISGAQMWCSVTRPEFDKTQNVVNEHTPFNYRIIGAFSNSESFASDFKCDSGTRMNPVNKCEIW